MRRALRGTGVVLAIIVVLVVAVGCGHSGETDTAAAQTAATLTGTTATGASGPGPTEQGPPTIAASSSTAGAAAGISRALPDDFPLDVPLYSSGTVTEATKTAADTGVTYRVIIQSNDDGAIIFDWYKTELPKAGWTITMSLANGANSMMNATKGTMSVALGLANATDGEHKTLVSVIVMTTQ